MVRDVEAKRPVGSLPPSKPPTGPAPPRRTVCAPRGPSSFYRRPHPRRRVSCGSAISSTPWAAGASRARALRNAPHPRQPAPCRLSREALEDRAVPASLSVSDAVLVEGNAGTQYAAVIVRLSAPSSKTVTVNYGTANGTATAGSDYNAVSGKLTFARGETSKTILVPVLGDRLAEQDETFSVKLSGAKNARIDDGTASSPSGMTSCTSASAMPGSWKGIAARRL